jgi:hypothetical protein
MSEELKPCRSCGKPPRAVAKGKRDRGAISCVNPDCVDFFVARNITVTATEAWNRRPVSDLAAKREAVLDVVRIMVSGQDWNAWKPQLIPRLAAYDAAAQSQDAKEGA